MVNQWIKRFNTTDLQHHVSGVATRFQDAKKRGIMSFKLTVSPSLRDLYSHHHEKSAFLRQDEALSYRRTHCACPGCPSLWVLDVEHSAS